jgi:hypothetical protein
MSYVRSWRNLNDVSSASLSVLLLVGEQPQKSEVAEVSNRSCWDKG